MAAFIPFYSNTYGKLREIFSEHCNLSLEQYEVISGEFIYLIADIQDGKPQEEIEERMHKMRIIFDFLLETKELTRKEHIALHELVDDIWESAQEEIIQAAMREGTVL